MFNPMERQGQSIKIPAAAYEQLKQLAADIARHGWAAYGIDRTDPAIQTAVIEEAIRCLAAQRQAKRRKP
jgi:hypothetical protein